MVDRPKELIALLQLVPHPEGGHYRELHRSSLEVMIGTKPRAAITSIYFLLSRGEHSRLHRVRGADELWYFHEGNPLELLTASPEGVLHRAVLGPSSAQFQAVVPAGWWQAARSLGDYSLVGCSVGPGFDFEDFEMIDATSEEARTLLARHGELGDFI